MWKPQIMLAAMLFFGRASFAMDIPHGMLPQELPSESRHVHEVVRDLLLNTTAVAAPLNEQDLTAALQSTAAALGTNATLATAAAIDVTVDTLSPTRALSPTDDDDDESNIVSSLLRLVYDYFVPIMIVLGCAIVCVSAAALFYCKTTAAGAGETKETRKTQLSLDYEYPGTTSYSLPVVANPLN